MDDARKPEFTLVHNAMSNTGANHGTSSSSTSTILPAEIRA